MERDTWRRLRFSPSGEERISRNRTTLSKLSSGSPMPIKTKLAIFSPVSSSAAYTSSSISDGVRFRTQPARVEAQKLQPIRHPTWVEMHKLFPYLYRMTTASTQLPSESSSRYFTVPSSLETSLRRMDRLFM